MPIRVGVKDECRMDRGPDQLIEADEQRRGAALRFRKRRSGLCARSQVMRITRNNRAFWLSRHFRHGHYGRAGPDTSALDILVTQ